MRSIPSTPFPGGISGSNQNMSTALANSAPGGAAAGPDTSNAIGGMSGYGAGIGQTAANCPPVGGQNNSPASIACPSPLRGAPAKKGKIKVPLGTNVKALLSSDSCDVGSGGSGASQGPGTAGSCMSSCCLNNNLTVPAPGGPPYRRCLPCDVLAFLRSIGFLKN